MTSSINGHQTYPNCPSYHDVEHPIRGNYLQKSGEELDRGSVKTGSSYISFDGRSNVNTLELKQLG